MDSLSLMLTPPKDETEGEERRDRLTELKTYLLETNTELVPAFKFGDHYAEISDTGLDSIKILRIQQQNKNPVEFYLDKSDKRFLLLHTNYLSDETHNLVERIAGSTEQQFDSAWLSTTMLKEVSSQLGNSHFGYSVEYDDIFQSINEDDIIPEDDIKLEVSGGLSDTVLQLTETSQSIKQKMGYKGIKIARGTNRSGVLDDLSYNGRFSVKRGKSIDDHMILVDNVKHDYRAKVEGVERNRLYGTRAANGTVNIEGDVFDFSFERNVENWEKYLTRIFNAKEPFRIWGMKNKIDNRFYRVLGVDMHTGHPIDVEVSDHLFRVYLPKDSCGNVVLRLFVNLQRYFDSTIECSKIA